jgi:hypothetical protein
MNDCEDECRALMGRCKDRFPHGSRPRPELALAGHARRRHQRRVATYAATLGASTWIRAL